MTEFTVSIRKADMDVSIDESRMSAAVQQYAKEYGYRQILADCAASVSMSANIEGRKVALKGKELAQAKIEARKLVEAKLTDLYNGVIRKVRSASGDPVENRARQLAIKTVQKMADFRAWVADNGLKFTDETATVELAKRAAEYVESNPKVRKIAARQIADEADLAELDGLEGDEQAEAAAGQLTGKRAA